MIDVRCKQIASIDVKLTVAEVKNVSHLMSEWGFSKSEPWASCHSS